MSDATVCVVDNSLFLPVARRLARDFKRVLYFTEWERDRVLGDAVPGDGFPDVERCNDPWEKVGEIDLWVFPDVGRKGWQKYLESQGKLVWGCRDAQELEANRQLFLRTLKEVGLNVPPHTVVVGLTALRKFLEDQEDVYIKVSRFRGSFETSHFRSMKEDRGLLDLWGVKLGPVSELVGFIVFPNIDTPLEIGADTYVVNGRWPSRLLHGIEWKDKSYFAAVTDRLDMPEQIQEVMEKFAPALGNARMSFSMEVRVKEKEGYFIDATCRGGLPSTASQLAMKNYSQVIYHGAAGELVEPDFGYQFSAESIVSIKGDETMWQTCEMPKSLEGKLQLTGCCLVDGLICFPPDAQHDSTVGWLCATGDDQEEVVMEMNRLADELPDGMDASTECLAYVLKEIHEAAEQGVEFSEEPTPEPEVVFQEED